MRQTKLMKAALFITLICLGLYTTSKSQGIVFAVNYKFNFNPLKGKLIGGYVAEDSVTNEKVIVIGGNKSFSFFLVDPNWKILKTFESKFDKSSNFSEDRFRIFRSNHNGNVWTMIVQNMQNYTAEIIDFGAQKHMVVGKVFSDKHPDDLGSFFISDNKAHVMYFSKNYKMRVAELDENGGLKTITIDPLEVSSLKRASRISGKDLFRSSSLIDDKVMEDVQSTEDFAHFYVTPTYYITVLADSDPVAEVSYFDKNTGRRVKSELFSVAELLPASERSGNRTNFLIYDNKIWVLSMYKNGGALGAFDLNTKKLVYSLKYDEKSPATIFNYGPVLLKTQVEKSGDKNKSETVSMDKFSKLVFTSYTGLIVHANNDNEYSVSIAYLQYGTTDISSAISTTSHMTTDYTSQERMYAKLLFRKNDFAWIPKSEPLAETTSPAAQTKIREVPKTAGEPEFKNKRAAIIKEFYMPFRHVTIYYFENQVKIYERPTIADMTKLNPDR
jgi:hypothetical protein